MNGLSGSEINTGWKPVAHDEESVPTPEGTPLQNLNASDKTDPAPDAGMIADQPLAEILNRLVEIHREILSLKELMSGMGTPDAGQDAMRRRKLRRKHIFKSN